MDKEPLSNLENQNQRKAEEMIREKEKQEEFAKELMREILPFVYRNSSKFEGNILGFGQMLVNIIDDAKDICLKYHTNLSELSKESFMDRKNFFTKNNRKELSLNLGRIREYSEIGGKPLDFAGKIMKELGTNPDEEKGEKRGVSYDDWDEIFKKVIKPHYEKVGFKPNPYEIEELIEKVKKYGDIKLAVKNVFGEQAAAA